MEDATFGASKLFGSAYFRVQILERWPQVWLFKWFCRHLLVGPIFMSSINVFLENSREDVREKYVLSICWVYPGRMECGGGGVVWLWWTSEIVEGDWGWFSCGIMECVGGKINNLMPYGSP